MRCLYMIMKFDSWSSCDPSRYIAFELQKCTKRIVLGDMFFSNIAFFSFIVVLFQMSSNSAYSHVSQGPALSYANANAEHSQELHAPPPDLYEPYSREDSFDHVSWAPQHQYDGLEIDRNLARTLSPTPSEREALQEKKMFNLKKLLSLKRENWCKFSSLCRAYQLEAN